ncbi:MAG: hypothetical protein CM15mP120_09380 [Pseudomonadota bacterium]|nr:MAG: hypothetical protein CM15mP120_09380 [Pseudomonadota bacterium]
MPVADTMGCLMDLKREGKIRAIGVSNVNLDQLTEYQSFGCVDSNQLRYNMLNREAEAEALAHCHDHNIAAMTYTSLEQGLLTGKVTLTDPMKNPIGGVTPASGCPGSKNITSKNF